MAANARTRCLSALTRGGQIDAVNAAPSAAGQEPTPGPTRTPASSYRAPPGRACATFSNLVLRSAPRGASRRTATGTGACGHHRL
jgi:hypothetical protein